MDSFSVANLTSNIAPILVSSVTTTVAMTFFTIDYLHANLYAVGGPSSRINRWGICINYM